MVRDAMLAVSGTLDPRLGGPELPRPRHRQGARARPPSSTSPVDPSTPGSRPPDALPRLGPRRPERVARRLRLPRPLDHRAPPRRHDHAAPGPGAAEQRPGPPPGRRLRRPAGARGRRRRRRGRSSAPTGSPSAGARRPTSAAQAVQVVETLRRRDAGPGDLQQQRVPLRRLKRSAHERNEAAMDRRDFFSWVQPRPGRRRGRVACCSATARSGPASPARRARPARTSPPKADARHPHLPRAAR